MRSIVEINRHKVFLISLLSVILFLNAADGTSPQTYIGFFSPAGVDDFVYHVDFSMLNAYLVNDKEAGRFVINLGQLRPSFEAVRGLKHKINIELGLVISDVRESHKVRKTYVMEDGKLRTKVFEPLFPNKLRDIVSDNEIEHRLKGFTDFVRKHRENVGVLFISDEPYLNGISRQELERAIKKVRSILSMGGVPDIEIGIVFASAMFNKDAAEHIQKEMGDYVARIDDHYMKNSHLLQEQSMKAQEFRQWVSALQRGRLTTYDSCSNIFTGGGLPEGLDVVAFDFYLSTLLLDKIHNTTLRYYAERYNNNSCNYFRDKSIGDVRKELSFFGEKSAKKENAHYKKDRKILDMAFDCRMRTTVDLLRKEIRNSGYKNLKIMLIGESSANGLLDFKPDGTPKSEQSADFVEQRMLDEVKRSMNYYLKNIESFQGGLIFFLYPDSFDNSINLFVSGAKGAQKVKSYIYRKRNLSDSNLTKVGNPPILLLLDVPIDTKIELSESQAKSLLGDWYVLRSPLVVIHPDGGSVSLSVDSSNPQVIEADITPDNHLRIRYREGTFGETAISVTAHDRDGLTDTKRFSISVSPPTQDGHSGRD